MKKYFKDYLFNKHILVAESETESKDAFESAYSLYGLFGIRVVSGAQFACKSHLSFVSHTLGKIIPEPFYKGFPESVRSLSPEELLFDQLVSYTKTYGFGHFEEREHSIMERLIERTPLDESVKPVDFVILTEQEAVQKAAEYVENLLDSSRPINESQYSFLTEYVLTYNYPVTHCASKNTAIKLMGTLRNTELSKLLVLSDVYKLVDWLNYFYYGVTDTRKLNLRNADRKFITKVIDNLMTEKSCDLRTCFEKKAFWCGLLHHIHYKPGNELAKSFVECMRNKGNGSVYSDFERAIANGDAVRAANVLADGKGSGALLRNLDFVLSRCKNAGEVEEIISGIDSSNGIILLQLLLRYSRKHSPDGKRRFKFVRYNKMATHTETPAEVERRRSIVSKETENLVLEKINRIILKNYSGKLGKVYIDDAMKKIALPLQEGTSSGGYGTLTKGSRVSLEPEAETLRAFTYWERVNDIDLSVIGVNPNGGSVEFSWRTMASKQSEEITYSGDEVSGYEGGSEYFDINLNKIQKKYPDIRYLVFCDNVYSSSNFSQCFCKAGYMLRQKPGSGEVFEPKTVKTSFLINAESSFAYLFAIDLATRELIWLNCAEAANYRVAGMAQYEFLLDYFDITSVINVHSFFSMLATELTDDPSEADTVVADETLSVKPGAEQIRSYDTERIMALMNGR